MNDVIWIYSKLHNKKINLISKKISDYIIQNIKEGYF